jgi:hypothetical protein
VTLYARLNTVGDRVMCGKAKCKTELAQIDVEPLNPFLPLDSGTERRLYFGPGWVPRAGDRVWVFSKRVAWRQKQGEYPAARRLSSLLPNVIGTKRIRHGGEIPGEWDVQRQRYIRTSWRQPDCFPTDAVCPRCGFRQVLDPEMLRVDPPSTSKRLYSLHQPQAH